MDLETFRAIDVDIDLANDFVPDVILSANDYNGRCIVARVTNGGVNVSGDNLSARLLFNTAPGISPGGYVTMTRVASSPTATWQVPVPSDALAARQVMLCVQIVDSDDNLVCSRNFRGIVDRKLMDDDAPESVNELNRLWEGIDALENIDASVTADGTVSVTAPDGTVTTSTAVPTAVSAANSATSAANTAATAANTAASAASTAATSANAAAARAEEAARPTEEMFASYHALLKAGASEGIASDANPVQSSFLNRASGSAEGVRDGIATIECIKGNTVGWNQLGRPITSAAERSGITYTPDGNGGVSVSGTAESNSTLQIGFNAPIKSGSKYLLKGCPSNGSPTTYFMNMMSYDITGNPRDTGSGIIFTGKSDGNTGFAAYVMSGTTVSNLVFRPQLFDLTAMFGAGNEPATVEEFEALYPLPYYAYDPGTLKPVMFEGMETVGFNQWDEEWELGKLSTKTGEKVDGTTSIRSKNFIPVVPNTRYMLSAPQAYGASTCYDADKNFISSTPWAYAPAATHGYYLDIPANAHYILFSMGANYGTTYNHDINLNISGSGYRDGEHEPYWMQQREIDVAQYFPTGMKAVSDDCHDALYKDHADTVIGEVDLGAVNWNAVGNPTDSHFRFSLIMASRLAKGSDIKVSKALNVTSYQDMYNHVIDDSICCHPAASQLEVYSSKYTTAADFKAAMSGVICYFELLDSAKTTEVIDPPLNLGYKVSDFGTERVMLADGVISAPPIFEIAYGYTAESLRDAAASIVAPVENHLAQDNYAIGSYLVRDGVLYKVTAAIARNEAIVPGTNVTATTVMAEIAAING